MVTQDIVNQLHAENELMALLANVLASLLIPKTFSRLGCKHLIECLPNCGHAFISLDTFIVVLKAIFSLFRCM